MCFTKVDMQKFRDHICILIELETHISKSQLPSRFHPLDVPSQGFILEASHANLENNTSGYGLQEHVCRKQMFIS